jgi:hypothetical protein
LEVKTIYVDMRQLIRGMLDVYYENEMHERHTWFASSHNLPMAVCNFLRTRDCFKESYPDPQVRINFSAKRVPNQFRVDIFGDVMWFAPDVRPMGLPDTASPGSELRLVPQYLEHILEDQWSSYPVDSDYEIVSKGRLSLAWDQTIQGFRGIVPGRTTINHCNTPKKPGYSADQYAGRIDQLNVIEVALTVSLTKHFPGNVRFELASRFKVRVRIAPSPYDLRGFLKYLVSVEAPSVSLHKHVPQSIDTTIQSKFRYEHEVHNTRGEQVAVPRVTSWVASFENTPVSKRGSPVRRDLARLSTHHEVHKAEESRIDSFFAASPSAGRASYAPSKSDGPISSFRLPSPLKRPDVKYPDDSDACEQVTQAALEDSDSDSDVPLEMAIYRRGGGHDNYDMRVISGQSSASLPDTTQFIPLRRKRHGRTDSMLQDQNDYLRIRRVSATLTSCQEDEVPLMEDMGPAGEAETPPVSGNFASKRTRNVLRDSGAFSNSSTSDTEGRSTIYNLRASPAAPNNPNTSYTARTMYNYYNFPRLPSGSHRAAKRPLYQNIENCRQRLERPPKDSQPPFKALRLVLDHLMKNHSPQPALENALNSSNAAATKHDSPFGKSSINPNASPKRKSKQPSSSHERYRQSSAWARDLACFDPELFGDKVNLPNSHRRRHRHRVVTPVTSPSKTARRRIVTLQQSQIQANYEAFLKQKQEQKRTVSDEEDLAAWILEGSSSQEWESGGLGDDEGDDEDEAIWEHDGDEEVGEVDAGRREGGIKG